MHLRCLILSVLLLLGSIRLSGQEIRKEVCIGFPQGSSLLDTAFGDNAHQLDEVMNFLESVNNDQSLELSNITFGGSASPEGPFAHNADLATARRNAVEQTIRSQVTIPENIITRLDGTIAWDRLAELTEASDMPHKDEAVDVLRHIPEYTYDDQGALTDSRKKHLMELQYGRTWQYMDDHFFAQMRNASVIVVTVRPTQAAETVPTTEVTAVQTVETDPAPAGKAVTAENPAPAVKTIRTTPTTTETKKPRYWTLKTNMLYDVLLVPNIGAEYYLGKNWSIAGNWMYAWWSRDSSHHYWRIYGGDIAVRRWFGKKAEEKPLQGHHIGVYGQLFTYDFEWGDKGYMGGKPGGTIWEKLNYAAGVEYGYSMPIARKLNLDFTIGVGYWGGKYYEYIPIDNHYVWQATKNRNWFGPTKAEDSLVWLLGKHHSNARKGGAR